MGLENEPRAMQVTNVTLTNYATKAKRKLKGKLHHTFLNVWRSSQLKKQTVFHLLNFRFDYRDLCIQNCFFLKKIRP